MNRLIAVLVGLSAGGAALGQQGLNADTAPGFDTEIRACAEKNSVHQTLTQRQHVRVVSEDGWTRESTRTVRAKQFAPDHIKVLFRVDAPASEAGLKVLVEKQGSDDPVVHVYSPETGRARRMMGSGAANSVLGTDLTFEDALYFQKFGDAGVTRRGPDRTVDGRAAFTLESFPGDGSAYSRIAATLDKHLCLPIEVQFFGPNGSLVKRFRNDLKRMATIAGQHYPLYGEMHDLVRRSRSEFTIEQIDAGMPLSDRLFSLREIRKGH